MAACAVGVALLVIAGVAAGFTGPVGAPWMIPNPARTLLPRRRAFASGATIFVFFGANSVGSFASFGSSSIVNSFHSKSYLRV